jgi:hypothetical protein
MANPDNYDEKGRPKKRGKKRLAWKHSRGYLATRRRKATRERKLKAHRKSLHGRMVHQIVRLGNTMHLEKISYQGWQKRFGTSVGLRAPGMLIDHLKRTVVSTGGTLIEVPTRSTQLSQFCHGCGERVQERARAGQVMPQSMGVPRARARLPQSLSEPTQEPVFLLRRGRLEAWKERLEPPVL